MSEKRFSWKTEKLQHSDDEVIMVVDNANKEWKGHILNIVDKLNELSEENEKLKKEKKDSEEDVTDYHNALFDLHKKFDKLEKENEQLKNELRKEKSLREYSDSMYDADLIVNIRFSNGEWKADVSVIDDE